MLKPPDIRGVDLISDTLPFGRLWYGGPDATTHAIGYAQFCGRSEDAVIHVFDESGNLIETHDTREIFVCCDVVAEWSDVQRSRRELMLEDCSDLDPGISLKTSLRYFPSIQNDR